MSYAHAVLSPYILLILKLWMVLLLYVSYLTSLQLKSPIYIIRLLLLIIFLNSLESRVSSINFLCSSLVQLIRSIRCCNDISNISNSFLENEEESHVFRKRIRFHFTA